MQRVNVRGRAAIVTDERCSQIKGIREPAALALALASVAFDLSSLSAEEYRCWETGRVAAAAELEPVARHDLAPSASSPNVSALWA
jgi:hypothetical protein